ncbi:hypothetical protein P3T76_005675 [Phytophthora citrophthora]|uniref:Uncharacterized protein n=1 Tax=Phytophthora citrophthora TaxID=4793 RepID=A0AAD9GRR5_9STRA|nr:hypothetical protein P3T76_005675 [Phytophthora citrophthora]
MVIEHENNAKLVEVWAALTTEAWTKEVQQEWRKKQRRATLARFRVSKKKKFSDMCNEKEHLELQVKRRLAALNAIACSELDDTSPLEKICNQVCLLALESDTLRNENREMYDKLQVLKRTWSLMQEAFMDVNGVQNSTPSNLYEASEKSQWVSHPRPNESGWRVFFPNCEPSFYFHPFTREEFETLYQTSMAELLVRCEHVQPVGKLFGWTVHHALSVDGIKDNSPVACARFTLRTGCSLQTLDELVLQSDLKWLPLVVIPPSWNTKHLDTVSSQVLQEFETDAYIMVNNIPGDTHLRYVHLIRRMPRRTLDGRRSIAYTMAIVDNSENTRSREAEDQRDVTWAKGGCNMLTITEVDGNTVDVKFEFSAACQDELHVDQHYVYWAQFVCRWSERVIPPKLLD